MDLLLENEMTVLSSQVDMWSRLRTGVMASLLQDAAVQNSDDMGIGRMKALSHDALWVITRLSAEIQRMPSWDEKIIVRTWAGELRHGLYPRFFDISTADGELLLRASSVWLLMHAVKRHMVDPKTIDMDVSGHNREGQLPLPPRRVSFPETLSHQEQRVVRYSETDLNGHMNNTKYLDWADDLLSPEFHKNHLLKNLWVEYRSEIRSGESVTLHSELQENVLYLSGCTGEKEAFKVRAEYDSI